MTRGGGGSRKFSKKVIGNFIVNEFISEDCVTLHFSGGSHLGHTKSFIKLIVLIERVLSEPKAIYYV